MRKAIKNLVIGVIAAVSVFGTSLAAFAGTQFVQTDMNFRLAAEVPNATSFSYLGHLPSTICSGLITDVSEITLVV